MKFFPRTGKYPLTIRIDGRSLLHNGVTESWRHRVARTEPRDSAGSQPRLKLRRGGERRGEERDRPSHEPAARDHVA